MGSLLIPSLMLAGSLACLAFCCCRLRSLIEV